MSRLYKILNKLVPTGGDNSIQIGQMLIQWGYVSAPAPANGYQDTSVTFATPYSDTPSIQITTASTSTAAQFAQVEICVSAQERTGFTVRAFNYGTTGRAPGIRWLAIGMI